MSHHYAIFSARYAPLTGGVESYTQNLAHELARRGNRVSIVTSKLSDSPDYERIADRIEVWRLPARSLMNARLPLPLRNSDYAAMLRQMKKARCALVEEMHESQKRVDRIDYLIHMQEKRMK
jgi:hypothetical protein